MYTHRGAYLNALGEIIHSRHSPHSVYLWTLPMFHCNGWCTTWGVTAIGGTHVCLPRIDPALIWSLIESQGVTHFNAAPTILISLVNAPEAHPFPRPVTITTGGAPPSPTLVEALEGLGSRIVHLYGLTETYGPHTVCELQDGVEDMPVAERPPSWPARECPTSSPTRYAWLTTRCRTSRRTASPWGRWR